MAQILKLDGLTINLVNTVASAGSTVTVTTTTTSAGLINGKFVTTLASGNNVAVATATDATTGAAFLPLGVNKTCALVFGQNAAGTSMVAQGPIIDTYVGVTTTVGAFKDAPQFPPLPDNFLPLAYTLVRTAPSASAWTPLTSNWTASGVSATTFQNVGVLPNRPQIA